MPASVSNSESPGLWAALWEWCAAHGNLLAWLGIGSLVSLLLVAALLPVIVVRLAPDHFLQPHAALVGRGGIYRLLLRVAKNLLGLLFLLAGFLMLFLPGQGVLTMLIGILLLEFPGKRKLELRILRRRGILDFLNRLRARYGRPPLRID